MSFGITASARRSWSKRESLSRFGRGSHGRKAKNLDVTDGNDRGRRFARTQPECSEGSDIFRAALASGSTVTAEGFLDQVGDSFAMLRWPRLNFLPVPEDVCVARTLIEQHHLRPGQKVAGTVQLPGQRGKFLSLEKVTSI